eukprot:1148682-Pelagomonas_calceolata.AAC.7
MEKIGWSRCCQIELPRDFVCWNQGPWGKGTEAAALPPIRSLICCDAAFTEISFAPFRVSGMCSISPWDSSYAS